jgi:AraC family transcriptional regulator
MTKKCHTRWTEKLFDALQLLSSRLDDPPSLSELAAAAQLSPFHFHRIWRVLLNESVHQTVARLRVAAAQQRLRRPAATVTEVAMDAGFATPQSFARAFRRVSGISPSEFAASDLLEIGVKAASSAEVQVELRPECRLVALGRNGGAYRELNALFAQVWAWAEECGRLQLLEGIYGRPLDDPLSVSEEQLRYEACLAFREDFDVPQPFYSVVLATGEYARLRHIGSYDRMEEANLSITRWTLLADRKPANVPLIHHFLDDPDITASEQLRADVLLLLEPQEGAN